jgi:hypothetical protein
VLMLGDAHFGPTPFRIDPNALEVVAASLRQRQVMGAELYMLCERWMDVVLFRHGCRFPDALSRQPR